MNSRMLVVAGLLAVAAPAAARAQNTEVVVAPVVVDGEVVRYEPGRVIVLKSDGREVSYALTPEIKMPADVQVGRRVSVYTERGADGTTTVARVTTTAITPEGQTKRTVEETRTAPTGETTKTTTVSVQGTVKTYLPGKTLTVLKADGTPVTYKIAAGATMPSDLAVGKIVTVRSAEGGTMQIIVEKD